MRLELLVLALILAAPLSAPAGQLPPRDPRVSAPVVVPPAADDEAELTRKIEANPSDPENYVALAAALERRGAYDEAEATLLKARTAAPVTPKLLREIASFYNRVGNFDRTIAVLEEAAALTPNDPAAHHVIATFYQEKVTKDQKLAVANKWTYVLQGIAAEDRALAIDPEYVEAMVYKNILLRTQANLEQDPGQRKVLLAEADGLRKRAIEIQRGTNPRTEQAVMAQPEAPPPPPSSCPGRGPIDGQALLRVGGAIKAPARIHNVAPVYPPDAMMARVQGIVIVEAVISSTGQVTAPCVLRSIPMLDQAALDAVTQWEFEPTFVNGAAVPVIVTVTVNFTLKDQ
jgi:TonB family protein